MMMTWYGRGLAAALAMTGTLAGAEPQATYNIYGLSGLIEMPTAQMRPDAELAFSFSHAGNALRNSLTFQVLPRVSGTFRYSRIRNQSALTNTLYGGKSYDRSFDLRYQFLDEGTYRPAMAVGLQDFIGTGTFSGEYVVASKTLGPVVATAGMGWGRLGSHEGFSNPLGALHSGFDTRPTSGNAQGGEPLVNRWFRGDAALFGGVAWAVNDRTTLKLEYSSDANVNETARGHFVRRSPVNLGLDYRFGRTGMSQASLYYLYGSEVGVMLSFATDPTDSSAGRTRDGGPLPVAFSAAHPLQGTGWGAALPKVQDTLLTSAAPILEQEGIVLEGLELSVTAVTVRIRNTRYSAQAQAVGRVARLLSHALPASVQELRIVPMKRGLPGSTVIIPRSALERYEHEFDGAEAMRQARVVRDAAGLDRRAGQNTAVYPEFTWAFGPRAGASLFDPDSPIRYEVGLEASAEWNPTPGLYVSGALRKRLFGNLGDSNTASDSVLPHVRSDGNVYNRDGDPSLEHLTVAYFFRPGQNLYGRVTAGYLERMYAGVSTELLWKPVNSRFALGAELNVVKQRSYDDMFGFTLRDVNPAHVRRAPLLPLSSYATREYDVVTGHVSAYYAFENGFHAQLDVGRYLAGDVGATIAVDRELNNGWKVGAYATFTDVSAAEFGEGSFDKGIVLEIPLDWQIGSPSRRVTRTVLQSLQRDGGARLEVHDRLYDLVRDTHQPQLDARWARFWR